MYRVIQEEWGITSTPYVDMLAVYIQGDSRGMVNIFGGDIMGNC